VKDDVDVGGVNVEIKSIRDDDAGEWKRLDLSTDYCAYPYPDV